MYGKLNQGLKCLCHEILPSIFSTAKIIRNQNISSLTEFCDCVEIFRLIGRTNDTSCDIALYDYFSKSFIYLKIVKQSHINEETYQLITVSIKVQFKFFFVYSYMLQNRQSNRYSLYNLTSHVVLLAYGIMLNILKCLCNELSPLHFMVSV